MPQSIPTTTFRPGEIYPKWSDPAYTLAVQLAPNSVFPAGTVIGQLSGALTNDVQTLTGNGVAGSFTLSYGGYTTTALTGTATAAQVQAALQALPSIGVGNVICTGGPLGTGTIVCTFQGALGGLPITLMTIANTTTTVTIAHTTTGVAGGRYAAYASGNNDGSQLGRLVLQYDCSTDNFGNVVHSLTTTTPERVSVADVSAAAYYVGNFRVADLVGVDANLLTLGVCRLIDGTSIADTEAVIRFY